MVKWSQFKPNVSLARSTVLTRLQNQGTLLPLGQDSLVPLGPQPAPHAGLDQNDPVRGPLDHQVQMFNVEVFEEHLEKQDPQI